MFPDSNGKESEGQDKRADMLFCQSSGVLHKLALSVSSLFKDVKTITLSCRAKSRLTEKISFCHSVCLLLILMRMS